jgi:hypothetical protein
MSLLLLYFIFSVFGDAGLIVQSAFQLPIQPYAQHTLMTVAEQEVYKKVE